MVYSAKVKKSAIFLRRKGASLNEISTLLHISKSTSSIWLKSVALNKSAKEKIKKKIEKGRHKALMTRLSQSNTQRKELEGNVRGILKTIRPSKELSKLLSSIFLWTEGGELAAKHVTFMNSSPLMIRTFITLFRQSFDLDETKFRALVHIHAYHNDESIKNYWSNLTHIPLTQFHKSYQKANTKNRIRAGYMGCIRISYYDNKIALELRLLYNMFGEFVEGSSFNGRTAISKIANGGSIPSEPAK